MHLWRKPKARRPIRKQAWIDHVGGTESDECEDHANANPLGFQIRTRRHEIKIEIEIITPLPNKFCADDRVA